MHLAIHAHTELACHNANYTTIIIIWNTDEDKNNDHRFSNQNQNCNRIKLTVIDFVIKFAIDFVIEFAIDFMIE